MPLKSTFPDASIPDDISLTSFIVQNLHKNPDHQLLIDPYGGESFTNQQSLDIIRKVSAGFHKKGLKVGDVVAVLLPNLTVFPLILLGIQNIGAIPATAYTHLTAREIVSLFENSDAQYLITCQQLLDKAKEVMEKVNSIKEIISVGEANDVTSFKDFVNNNGVFPEVTFDPVTTTALVVYSSGTTGLPKGVELTHYNIIANISQSLVAQVEMGDNHETLITFSPLASAFGAITTFQAILSSHTSVLMQDFDLIKYLQLIQQYKATKLFVVPPIVLALAKAPVVSQFDLSSVRIVGSGAAPLGAGVEAAFKARLPQAKIAQGYGMTELTCTSHNASTFVTGSVGQLFPNMTIKIISVETGEEVGLGQSGEIWLKGPNVMKGYFKNPKATAETIDQDGFIHTGDIGYMDATGNLFIVDRLKELIKYRGRQVAPALLEAVLLTHADVADAAVIGKPHEEDGERPLAFVVRKKDSQVSDTEIVEWVGKDAAPHNRLHAGVIFVDSIPKSPSGKILRKVLRAKLG